MTYRDIAKDIQVILKGSSIPFEYNDNTIKFKGKNNVFYEVKLDRDINPDLIDFYMAKLKAVCEFDMSMIDAEFDYYYDKEYNL